MTNEGARATVRVTPREKVAWSKAAAREGRTLAGWMRWHLNTLLKESKRA